MRDETSMRLYRSPSFRLKDIQAWRREIGNKVNQDAFERVHGGSGQRLSELESKLAQVMNELLLLVGAYERCFRPCLNCWSLKRVFMVLKSI